MHINPISVSNYNSSVNFSSRRKCNTERPENNISIKGPMMTIPTAVFLAMITAASIGGCGSNPVGPSTTSEHSHIQPPTDFPGHGQLPLNPVHPGHIATEETNGGMWSDPNRPEEPIPGHPGKTAIEETNGGLWSDPNRPEEAQSQRATLQR